MHPVERRRLGRADVGADVLERVVAEREQLAVGGEACLELGRRARSRRRSPARCSSRSSVQRTGTPSLRDGEPDQDDVGEDRRLDPERAAGVGRRQQPQPVARRPSAAAATPCSVNGPWKFAHAVRRPAASSQSRDDAVALDRACR